MHRLHVAPALRAWIPFRLISTKSNSREVVSLFKKGGSHAPRALELFFQNPHPDSACFLIGKQPTIGEDLHLFDTVSKHHPSDTRVVTAAIAACRRKGHGAKAVPILEQLLREGEAPDPPLFNAVVAVIVELNRGDLASLATSLYERMKTPSPENVASLVNMYRKFGKSDRACALVARELFSVPLDRKTFGSFTAAAAEAGQAPIASALIQRAQRGDVELDQVMAAQLVKALLSPQSVNLDAVEQAANLFDLLQRHTPPIIVNSLIYNRILTACIRVGKSAQPVGFRIAQHMKAAPDLDEFAFAALVNFYCMTGDTAAASACFRTAVSQNKANVVLATSLLKGLLETRDYSGAMNLLQDMLQQGGALYPNANTWSILFSGLQTSRDSDLILRAWTLCPEKNEFVSASLISALGDSDNCKEAELVFQEALKTRKVDAVVCTAMILAYNSAFKFDSAKNVLEVMRTAKIDPTPNVYAAILSGYAECTAFENGQALIQSLPPQMDSPSLTNAMIYFYGRCGSLAEAETVFRAARSGKRSMNVRTFSSMISAFAVNGAASQAVSLWQELSSVLAASTDDIAEVSNVSVLSVLNACSHAGLIDQALSIFSSLPRPLPAHVNAVVDTLSRAGRLDDAEKFLQLHSSSMPSDAQVIAYMCILSCSRRLLETERAERAFVAIQQLDSSQHFSSACILMANLYFSINRPDDARRMRALLDSTGQRKIAGISTVEVQGTIHAFAAGSTSHPATTEIHEKLQQLLERLKAAGYQSNLSGATRGETAEEKEIHLCFHSEKLALAFALLHTEPSQTIRITKNLRACVDCHSATKMIAKLENRRIVVRDANRFHHFHDGVCSCNDYF